MASYINFAVMAKCKSGDLKMVDNLSPAFYSNILRDFFREKDIGTPLWNPQDQFSYIDTDSKSFLQLEQENREEYRYITDVQFEELTNAVEKDKKYYEDKIETIKSVQVQGEEAFYAAVGDIMSCNDSIYGNDSEPGLTDVKNEIVKLKAIVEFVVNKANMENESLYKEKADVFSFGRGDLIIAWYIS